MTPKPPGSDWARSAGKGLTTSKRRNSRNAPSSTAGVSGSTSTERIIPATSSMTMRPGSFSPTRRSTRPDAATPATVTIAQARPRPSGETGTSQSTSAVTALPTVPGAIGANPAPAAVATIVAR